MHADLDESLLDEARRITGLATDAEILELGLRTIVTLRLNERVKLTTTRDQPWWNDDPLQIEDSAVAEMHSTKKSGSPKRADKNWRSRAEDDGKSRTPDLS